MQDFLGFRDVFLRLAVTVGRGSIKIAQGDFAAASSGRRAEATAGASAMEPPATDFHSTVSAEYTAPPPKKLPHK